MLKKLSIPALIALSAASCTAPAGQSWNPTLGLNRTVYTDYDGDSSGVSVDPGEVDYDLTGIDFGATRLEAMPGRDLKHRYLGLGLGFGELEDSDIVEVTGGARYYFDKGGKVIPFIAAWASYMDFEDLDGLDPQLGVRLGGGAEIPFNESTALVLGLDYLVPLVDAETESGPGEFEVDGLAARVGITFVF